MCSIAAQGKIKKGLFEPRLFPERLFEIACNRLALLEYHGEGLELSKYFHPELDTLRL